MKLRPYHLAWLLCLIVAGLVAILLLIAPKQNNSPVGGAALGGSFTLTDQNGQTVTDQSWPGKYRLVYFGFTHCPDMCPLGLNKIAEAVKALPQTKSSKIQVLFVTIDPSRDTPKVLKDYVTIFDPRFIGLTGTQEQVEHMEKLYRVYAAKSGDGPDYMMNHSGFIYLMSPTGETLNLFSPDDSSEQLRTILNKIL